DAELRQSTAFASIENMRKLEQRRVFWLSGSRMVAKDRRNPDSYKVRRAKAGGYRDYFDDGQVAEVDALLRARLLPGFGFCEPAAGDNRIEARGRRAASG